MYIHRVDCRCSTRSFLENVVPAFVHTRGFRISRRATCVRTCVPQTKGISIWNSITYSLLPAESQLDFKTCSVLHSHCMVMREDLLSHFEFKNPRSEWVGLVHHDGGLMLTLISKRPNKSKTELAARSQLPAQWNGSRSPVKMIS
jgi:hypothetical protein